MINKDEICVGSDIEVFLREKATGKYISAIDKIGGSKEEPRGLEKNGCCIQEDNVALEYNVPAVPLVGGSKEMSENIKYVLDTVRKVTKVTDDLEIVCCASAKFDQDQLSTPKAQEFGCEPDYNAWNDGLENQKPNADDKTLRSCGGHIHISYPGHNPNTSIDLVKVFDLFLGVPSIILDEDTERRKLYGKAGAFRFKMWGKAGGFEYRTLSNWWTATPEYVNFVFQQIEAAFDFYNKEGIGVEIHADQIQEAINTSNKELAYIICEQFGIKLPVNDRIPA